MAQQSEMKKQVLQELKDELEYNQHRKLELFAESTVEQMQLQAITGSDMFSDNAREKHRNKMREISNKTTSTESAIKWIEEMLKKYDRG